MNSVLKRRQRPHHICGFDCMPLPAYVPLPSQVRTTRTCSLLILIRPSPRSLLSEVKVMPQTLSCGGYFWAGLCLCSRRKCHLQPQVSGITSTPLRPMSIDLLTLQLIYVLNRVIQCLSHRLGSSSQARPFCSSGLCADRGNVHDDPVMSSGTSVRRFLSLTLHSCS